MPIALTICSANYLPYAKALGNSIIEHNPSHTFIIALADQYTDFDKDYFNPHRIIPVAKMNIPELEGMNSRYDIFELSCALKPFVIEYILNTEAGVEAVYYFNSDILVFNSMQVCDDLLRSHPLVLTPHIFTPIEDDELYPNEQILLRAGIYNAGFFGVSRCEETYAFLHWWKTRLEHKCFNDVPNGLFVDQLWLNWAPLLFKNVHILQDRGYNVAYWNFHERSLEKKADTYFINDQYPLTFFHYSGYDIHTPEIISKHQNRYSFETRPEFLPLYEKYRNDVLQNNYEAFASVPSSYGVKKEEPPPPPEKKKPFYKRIFK